VQSRRSHLEGDEQAFKDNKEDKAKEDAIEGSDTGLPYASRDLE
jgi:hypothetical protein